MTSHAGHDFFLSRNSDNDGYAVWRFDLDGDALLTRVPLPAGVKFDRSHSIIAIGGYLLEWGPMALPDYEPCYPYRLFEFDATSADPLAAKAVVQGLWTKRKFWSYRADFGNPQGAHESYDTGEQLMLLAFGNFVLNVIPTAGRGTYQLWNFDPKYTKAGIADPLPMAYTPQGSFNNIEADAVLLPIGNFVLDWRPSTGAYNVWSFDPQNVPPLALPTVQSGTWTGIDAGHELVVLGDYVLDWVRADRSYRLWRFDATSADPLVGPVRTGVLPAEFDAQTTLLGIEAPRTIDPVRALQPGTMDFMRSRIKHVVYLMVENRSFDHLCGWLYDKDETGINFVGPAGPFDGASTDMYNIDLGAKGGDIKVHLSKYKDGALSTDWDLDFLPNDPYHDNSDVLRQYFFQDTRGYANRAVPNMGGFVWNNGVHAIMQTYTPNQIPIINGLARAFAISDAWFSSMPSATDPNRAFAFTGSAMGQQNNFQNGTQYTYWPLSPHRPSMWKVLWSNGFTDWKLYNSVEWMGFVHSYHLYFEGTVPSLDANVADHISSIDQFKKDALAGTLPKFSFLEPIWISLAGTTSYHPGADLIPGERAVNEIYEALKAGPAWNETLFVITFDEHGGLYDHVVPPYAVNPWPNDSIDGFHYDMMGVRVPTVLVSPLIENQTIFRSETDIPYDATSFMSTLLHWYGIPKSRWGLGERARHAPTFEAVFQRDTPRTDAPTLTPSYDRLFPPDGSVPTSQPVHDIHRLMAPRLVWTIAKGKLSADEASELAEQFIATSSDLASLYKKINALSARLG